MARPAKQAYRESTHKTWPFWLWLLIGMMLGLLLSAITLFKNGLPTRPDEHVENPMSKKITTDINATDHNLNIETQPQKPKYDFYSVLPNMSVNNPEEDTTINQPPVTTNTQPESKPEIAAHYLQAGAFRSAGDAEQSKARLAFMGIQGQITSAQVNNETWYRVRIGPYPNPQTLNKAQIDLQKKGVTTIVLH